MDLGEFRGTLAQSEPPESMSFALQTLWWDAKGDLGSRAPVRPEG